MRKWKEEEERKGRWGGDEKGRGKEGVLKRRKK